jgi:hypothetical protein
MSRYTHVLRGQESEAIAQLPDLSLPSKNKAVATGTDDMQLTPKLTHKAYPGRSGLVMSGNNIKKLPLTLKSDMYKNDEELCAKNNRLTLPVSGETKMGRGGVEPPTHGFSVRCSTN